MEQMCASTVHRSMRSQTIYFSGGFNTGPSFKPELLHDGTLAASNPISHQSSQQASNLPAFQLSMSVCKPCRVRPCRTYSGVGYSQDLTTEY